MKSIYALLASVLLLSSSAFARPPNALYGDNPLKPSAESLIGQYLAETGADSFTRTFAFGEGGVPGPERLVVLVSPDSWAAFEKYFGNAPLLYQFHEPHQHNFVAAFKGKRGNMGRLADSFRFTYAGVLAIPINLSETEYERAGIFFDLAAKTPRRNDTALFPWRMSDERGAPYCDKRSEKNSAEWFVRMPIGKRFDETKRTNAYVPPAEMPADVQAMTQAMWTAPFGHQSLAQAVGVDALEALGNMTTPGRVAAALLGTASVERVPVVFRYVDDHKTPFDRNFDTYVDLDFNPPANAR